MLSAVPLLASSTAGEQRMAVRALGDFAGVIQSTLAAIVQACAIEPLTQRLRSGTARELQVAVHAHGILACGNQGVQAAFVQAGSMVPLGPLLTSSATGERKQQLGRLMMLL